MAWPFYLVDVFAERPYAGNQLAVVVSADELSDQTMQQIAAETNYSETTFVRPTPEHDAVYRVRIFTPAREIAFAGHPILGTAWVVRHYLAPQIPERLRLSLAVGEIPITFDSATGRGEVVWFSAPPVSIGATCGRQQIATALGISADDVDAQGPVQQFSATTSAIIVPLRSLEALQRCRLDLDRFAPLADQGFPPLVYAFCCETRQAENDLSARFFFEAHGVREDPATGNGAAFLGTYLLEHRFFPGSEFSLRIEQGHEIRRPSLVMLRARRVRESTEVSVGGHVILTIHGELL